MKTLDSSFNSKWNPPGSKWSPKTATRRKKLNENNSDSNLGSTDKLNKTKNTKVRDIKKDFLRFANKSFMKFENVVIPDRTVEKFTPGFREVLNLENKEKDDNGNEVYIARNVQQASASRLTEDQRLMNLVYNKELSRVWAKSLEIAKERITEWMNSGGRGKRLNEIGNPQMSEVRQTSALDVLRAKETSDAKAANEAGADSKGAEGNVGRDAKDGSGDDNNNLSADADDKLGSNVNKTVLEFRGLKDMSIRRLNKWIEEDEERIRLKEDGELNEKRNDAKMEFQRWVEKKDRLRIRLPPSDIIDAHHKKSGKGSSRMGFGRECGSNRSVTAGASSTAELMATSGLRYIHALKEGPDLQKSKKDIMKMGYLSKENFPEEDRDLYLEEKQKRKVEKQKLEQAKAEKDKQLGNWADQKGKKERARKLLTLLECPVVGYSTSDSTASRARGHESEEGVIFAVNVGRALKKIDYTLIDNWAQWCTGMISFNTCLLLWDYFEPNVYFDDGTKTKKDKNAGIVWTPAEIKKRRDICTRYGVTFVDPPAPSKNGDSSGADAKNDSKPNSTMRSVRDSDDYGDDFEETADRPSDPSKYKEQLRKEGMKFLMDETRDARQEEVLKKMLSEGSSPQPPILSVATLDNIEVDEDEYALTDCLLLTWEPPADSLVSFYSLEMNMAPPSKAPVYQEIYRDPPDANVNSSFKLKYWVGRDGHGTCKSIGKLQPGTNYQFRIRGMNGFGPGDFAYKQFTTRPAPPAPPRVVKIAYDSVTLRWVFSAGFFKALGELRKLFDLADSSKDGQVSREELLHALERPSSPELQILINKAMKTLPARVRDSGLAAVFDELEGNDDNLISWDEFERFFLNAGWTSGSGGSMVASQTMGASMMGSQLRASTRTGSKSDASKLTYVVEECKDEWSNHYTEVLRTNAGQATLTRLEPGKSYRYRVYSITEDINDKFGKTIPGQKGPVSQSVVVHTLLETPVAPKLTKVGLGPRSLQMIWKARHANQSTRDKRVQDKIFNQWTGVGEEEEGAVSVELAWKRYDRDGNGTIDTSELALMLEDLGVEVTEERVREAFASVDTNRDGIITYEEFSVWWTRDDVVYTLKRSEPIQIGEHGRAPMATTGNMNASIAPSKTIVAASAVPMPIVCYRGPACKATIAGLDPNTLYHFKARYVGSRSESELSTPLIIMTAPNPPSTPILIRKSSATCRVKWYPGKNGAYKFRVEAKKEGEENWSTMFNGPECLWKSTTLASSTWYNVRIIALNQQGGESQPSSILRFCTDNREENKDSITPKNADNVFIKECTGDICVGDTILFTERLFANDGAVAAGGDATGLNNHNRGSKSHMRMDMSVTSLGSRMDDAPQGVYIGERTVAAHVVRDNFRSERDTLTSSNVGSNKYNRRRRLGLEIIWQRASPKEACAPYDYKRGEVVEKRLSHLEQFEVFRCEWIEEGKRIRIRDELDLLADCYIFNPHVKIDENVSKGSK